MSKNENDEKYVLIIGSSNMDLNIYSQKLPKPGETVTGGTFRQSLGGKGANQAVASARSGAKTVFIGKIGTDTFGDQMLTHLHEEGIDINHVIKDKKHSSGVAFILIDENGENMISVAPGANFHLTRQEIIEHSQIIKNASALVVQMEIPIETIEEIFKIASEGKAIKILNPAPLKPIPNEILRDIDIIVPNEGELVRLNSLLALPDIKEEGNNRIVEISKNIAKLGPKWIITTLGNRGCLIYDRKKDKSASIPTIKVEAVDTVGAGDCFNGVLASKLSRGDSIINAAKYAIAASSIAVTRKGAQESMPHSNEIELQFKKMNSN
ncbi:MAG: ribokinase [Promethearchaeota archaeon]|nr:MAG: ribokinase [Candidatus Lokiarchaeota archaeon]